MWEKNICVKNNLSPLRIELALHFEGKAAKVMKVMIESAHKLKKTYV